MQWRGSHAQRPSSSADLGATSPLSSPLIQLRGATGLYRA